MNTNGNTEKISDESKDSKNYTASNVSGSAANGENPDDTDTITDSDLDLIDMYFAIYRNFIAEEDRRVLEELLEKNRKEKKKEEEEEHKRKEYIPVILNAIKRMIENEKDNLEKLKQLNKKLNKIYEQWKLEQEYIRDDMENESDGMER